MKDVHLLPNGQWALSKSDQLQKAVNLAAKRLFDNLGGIGNVVEAIHRNIHDFEPRSFSHINGSWIEHHGASLSPQEKQAAHNWMNKMCNLHFNNFWANNWPEHGSNAVENFNKVTNSIRLMGEHSKKMESYKPSIFSHVMSEVQPLGEKKPSLVERTIGSKPPENPIQ